MPADYEDTGKFVEGAGPQLPKAFFPKFRLKKYLKHLVLPPETDRPLQFYTKRIGFNDIVVSPKSYYQDSTKNALLQCEAHLGRQPSGETIMTAVLPVNNTNTVISWSISCSTHQHNEPADPFCAIGCALSSRLHEPSHPHLHPPVLGASNAPSLSCGFRVNWKPNLAYATSKLKL